MNTSHHQLGRLVSESACERKDPGLNPAADMVTRLEIRHGTWINNRIIIEELRPSRVLRHQWHCQQDFADKNESKTTVLDTSMDITPPASDAGNDIGLNDSTSSRQSVQLNAPPPADVQAALPDDVEATSARADVEATSPQADEHLLILLTSRLLCLATSRLLCLATSRLLCLATSRLLCLATSTLLCLVTSRLTCICSTC
ncbi:hypothetical protein FHG87_021700 [Trinorchestia longiramus]|nr:hypothetical protein FHG87_021700 [Trinorchestia longiramus]